MSRAEILERMDQDSRIITDQEKDERLALGLEV